MNPVNSYSRKISKKEADKGFIFILKSKLSYFPKSSFTLSDGDITEVREIKSYPCTCRGPDRPHDHYYISWDNLEVGNIIEIRKNDSGDYMITQL
ncbi:hypothetical protein Metbo_0189 [Methanobacterium lacus]|uniref:Uncharacterized protein n=1 Tax=Methanobacterium lacus (strain AL-21) TaxID=877455 RepID=F0T7V4_METLA|nr:hypothetical protein [Methanobacterium lacus]ADZ08441.1 hypothetical protein Metbo_0189 [Methanobacterium lacus]